MQTGCIVTSVSTISGVKFSVKIEKRTIDYIEYVDADYLMIASGSSQQVVSSIRSSGYILLMVLCIKYPDFAYISDRVRDIILLFNLVTLL